MLKREKDQFANPVGHSIRSGIEGIFDQFLRGIDPEQMSPFLDRIIRIRAVQDFSPAQAVVFIFHLKKVLRELRGSAPPEERLDLTEILRFESKVDELALLAFDVYSSCRERLYEVRVEEVKSRSHRLLQRAGLLEEIPLRKREPENG